MDSERNIRLRHLLTAARDLSALFGDGSTQQDRDGLPLPGSALARIMAVLAMFWPAYTPRRQGRN